MGRVPKRANPRPYAHEGVPSLKLGAQTDAALRFVDRRSARIVRTGIVRSGLPC